MTTTLIRDQSFQGQQPNQEMQTEISFSNQNAIFRWIFFFRSVS